MPGIFNKTLATAIILSMLLITLFVPQVYAQTKVPTTFQYNCESHCYGIAYWDQTSETYLGIESYDSVRGINGGDSLILPNGIITNEVWLLDTNTYSPTDVWVEAGYGQGLNAAINPQNCTSAESFFWADNRYNGGFNTHCVSMSSGDYGHNVIDNIRENPSDHSQWIITITGYASGGHTYKSTQNIMFPNLTEIGEELVGYQNASGPSTLFILNRYQELNGDWVYYTSASNPTGNNPPWAAWYQGQIPAPGNNDGQLQACTLPAKSGGHYPC
ncbi:MAG TPA: hypothetical protein VJ761_09325 [Ktedonobacteraceae bacterium]|nr:hypothetical protein [Ktedonobacteraceae bacterium]